MQANILWKIGHLHHCHVTVGDDCKSYYHKMVLLVHGMGSIFKLDCMLPIGAVTMIMQEKIISPLLHLRNCTIQPW